MGFFTPKRIFLDYASATPVLRVAKEAMAPFWSGNFFNPSAIYNEGEKAKDVLESSRKQVAKILGVGPKGVVFTSGGTESVNLAILGAFEESLNYIKKPHLIISSIEHSSVIGAAEEVKRRGGEVSILEVDEEGVIFINSLKSLIKKSTFMISVGLANGEIGTVEPIANVGRLVKEFKKVNNLRDFPIIHTDASQAPNYLEVNLEHLQVDLLSVDGAKIYGPKGIGLLAMRSGVKIRPIIFGGPQEGGLRAGTESLPLVVGFTKALEVVTKDKEQEFNRLEELRRYFIETAVKYLPEAIINGSPKSHLPNIVSISIPGALAELLVLKLDREGVMASVGSTCSYDEEESGSPVIKALGRPELKESTIRFSFGRFTKKEDLEKTLEILCRISKM